MSAEVSKLSKELVLKKQNNFSTNDSIIDRIEKLKKIELESNPRLFTERAILVTQTYKENPGKPLVTIQAKSLENILDNIKIYISEGELIVGYQSPQPRCPAVYPEFGAKWVENELDKFSKRTPDRVFISKEDKKIFKDIFKFWKDKSVSYLTDNLIPKKILKSIEEGVITVGGRGTSIGNIGVDYPKVLKKGLYRIIAEDEACIKNFKPKKVTDYTKIDFWKASIISCKAVIRFAQRYSSKAREMLNKETNRQRVNELKTIVEICQWVPGNPARNFWEALQSLWFVHLVLHIETDPHGMSLGRFDQYMYPYYKKEIDEGKITKEDAKELLKLFWIKCSGLLKLRDKRYSKCFAGFPLFQNMTIGGQTTNGEDACNELSYLVLDAASEVKVPQPSINLRFHNKLPDKMLLKASKVIRSGIGYPAILNDNIIIPKMMVRGATLKEARNYHIICVETDIPGKTDSRAHSGYVNFVKCLNLALNNGVDMLTGKQIGPETGNAKEFKSYKDLWGAYKTQISYFIDEIVEAYNIVDTIHATRFPETFLSSILNDCIKNGKSRGEGGAKYCNSGIFGNGLAAVADSLAVIKKYVFEDNLISTEDLIEILKTNFKGKEILRQGFINKVAKYGNDDDYVDFIARDCFDLFCNEVQKHKCIRGGKYIAELHSVAQHVLFGEQTAASANGRKAGDPLSDGISPTGGMDLQGPTATINSVTKMDHLKALQGVLFNQKFHPTALAGKESLEKFKNYIKVYENKGGHHIQFNVISAETLRNAQKSPNNYKSLIVRVAGYSAFFVELNKNTQNEIIARTEQMF